MPLLRPSCLYLRKNPQSLKAVLKLGALQDGAKILRGRLEVAHAVLNFGHTKMGCEVASVVLQTQLIKLKRFLKTLLAVLDFSKYKIEVRSE